MTFFRRWLALGCVVAGLAGAPADAQEPAVRWDASAAASVVITDGAAESTVFLRAALPVWRHLFAEAALGVNQHRNTATFLYPLALRQEWPQPGWTPFLLAGGGGETVLLGSLYETRPLLLLGAGVLLPVHKSAFIRLDYQFQRVFAETAPFNRHVFLVGFLLRWHK